MKSIKVLIDTRDIHAQVRLQFRYISFRIVLKPLMNENELHHNGSFTAVPSSLL